MAGVCTLAIESTSLLGSLNEETNTMAVCVSATWENTGPGTELLEKVEPRSLYSSVNEEQGCCYAYFLQL